MSKQPPSAPTAGAVGPCPTLIQTSRTPALEVYPGPSHHPTTPAFAKNYLGYHSTNSDSGKHYSMKLSIYIHVDDPRYLSSILLWHSGQTVKT